MKKALIVLCVVPALTIAVRTWKEYPVALPEWCTSIYAVAVNAGGVGYAFASDGNVPGRQYLLNLRNGVWTPGVPPPANLAYPCVAADGAVYAIDNGGRGTIYRSEGSYWEKAAVPGPVGLDVFDGVAAVSRTEYWAYGTTTRGVVLAFYFQNDKVTRVFDLGRLSEAHYSSTPTIAVPRAASPNGDCYLVVQASDNPFNSNRWMLYILRTDGTFAGYPFPLNNYYCDGLSVYQPGDVRVMLTVNSGNESRLYAFAGGVFREIGTFPERVHLESYPSPTEGWGKHWPSRIYHWTGGAVTPADTVNGHVSDLDMVGPTEGWAVGCRVTNGVYTPVMWHYSDSEPSLTPTSLGRVKAAFR